MSVDLVAAFAGDREMTRADEDLICLQKETRGSVFFSDLLYAISHHYFAPEIAETLWATIVWHKEEVSRRLGRNIGITVAALDYLSNVTSELTTPTLISETYASDIANLAMRDQMTGLFNHSTCYELLELELRNHRRYGTSVSLLLLDIDDFKAVNDRKGHQEGDRILAEVGKALLRQARHSDICCRFGGDEFVVILRQTNDADEACEIARRIRDEVGTIAFDGRSISVSIGVAGFDRATACPRALIARADRALHRAKTTGKNRIVVDVMERARARP
jgi:diguanylate cyclase (GGDEF)-like protein